MPVPDAAIDETVGAVVSICRVPAGLVTAPREIGGVAGAILDGRAFRLTAVTARSAVFWPAATV